MAGADRRLSFVWLGLLELLAITATTLLYVLGVLRFVPFLGALLGGVVAAAGLFVGAYVLLARRDTSRRSRGPRIETVRADNGPAQADEYMNLGRQLLNDQRFDEAARMFEDVVSRNARNWQAYNYLGRACAGMGLYDEAKQAYEQAIGLEFNYASAHFNLAAVFEKLDQPDKALDRWRQYLEIGQTIGEKPEWLDHARERIAEIERRLGRRTDDDPWDDDAGPADDGDKS